MEVCFTCINLKVRPLQHSALPILSRTASNPLRQPAESPLSGGNTLLSLTSEHLLKRHHHKTTYEDTCTIQIYQTNCPLWMAGFIDQFLIEYL